jgi:hypothetical protein
MLSALLVWHSLERFQVVAGRARRSNSPEPLLPPDKPTSIPTLEETQTVSVVA